jgi:hypothetical protein
LPDIQNLPHIASGKGDAPFRLSTALSTPLPLAQYVFGLLASLQSELLITLVVSKEGYRDTAKRLDVCIGKSRRMLSVSLKVFPHAFARCSMH